MHNVFVHLVQGLSYRGVWIGKDGARTPSTVAAHAIEPSPGNARFGTYDAQTGELAGASTAAAA